MKKYAQDAGQDQGEIIAFQHLASTTNFDEIIELYSLPWFTRVWIVLEVTVAKELHILCGSSAISYKEFSIGTAVLHKMLQTFMLTAGNLTFTDIRSAWDLVSTRHAYQNKLLQDTHADPEPLFADDKLWWPTWQSIRILDYLESMRRECSDPRDKVYALLSLRDGSDVQISPDYAKSTGEVYIQFAKAYLALGEIRILPYAGSQRNLGEVETGHDHTGRSKQDKMPSWGPDWQCGRSSLGLGGSSRRPFSTAIKLSSNTKTDVQSNEISVAGYIMDTIKHRQGTLSLGQHGSEPARYATHERARESIAELHSFFEKHHPNAKYITGENAGVTFARTILLDGSNPQFETMFPHWKDPTWLLTLWTFFRVVKINPDDTINIPSNLRLPNPQTGIWINDQAHIVRTAWLIMTFMFAVVNNRCFFVTGSQYIGMAPAMAEEGDVVAVLAGAQTPFVLRPGIGGRYSLVGECYMHGVMEGEIPKEKMEREMGMLTLI